MVVHEGKIVAAADAVSKCGGGRIERGSRYGILDFSIMK